MSAANVRTSVSRLRFLDWTRGFAACIMLQGHVTHSFMRDDLRSNPFYVLSQFCGGLTPALFLFLTGVTLGFLMDSQTRKGLSTGQKIIGVLKRARYLLILAVLFRLQMWLFGLPASPVSDLFKVDILNCMAFSVAVLAGLSLLSTKDRVRAGALAGVIFASASPLASLADWSFLPAPLAAYLVPNSEMFAFFPWGSYVAFGVAAGSILRLVPRAEYGRLMQWATLAGVVLVLAARYAADLPYSLYPASDFWLNSPALVLIKLGVIFIVASFAYLWTEFAIPDKWSWVAQLGTTSLIVYWVHIELVYGRWFWFWKNNMTEWQTAAAALILIVLMVGLSVAQTRYVSQAAQDRPRNFRERLQTFARAWQPAWRGWIPSRAAGD